MRLMPLAVVLCLLPAAAAAGPMPPPLPVSAGSIAIASPGTADLAGYRIVVAPNGAAVAVDMAGRTQSMLSSSLTKMLFADAAAAMPLSKLAASPCMQGSKAPAPVMVSFNGETSPDVGCVGDARGAALFADAQTVARTLYVSNLRSATLPHFTGAGYQPPASQPAAPQPPPAPPPGGYGGYGHM